MQGPKKRLPVDTLLLLGAGASYAASLDNKGAENTKTAPLDGSFCLTIDNLTCKNPQWVSKTRDTIRKNWKDPSLMKDLGLEEAIIRKLGYFDVVDAIHKRRASRDNPKKFLEDIIRIITFVLRRTRENDDSGLYRKLFERYFSSTSSSEKSKNRVITFNYDTMLDKHFLKNNKPQEVYFNNLLSEETYTGKFENPLLLKLHGSINWVCKKELINGMFNITDNSEQYKISEIWHKEKYSLDSDKDLDSPCIMPPLPNKPIIQIELFKDLWTKAYAYLLEAKHLVICGYSLPITDRLATALFTSLTNKSLESVTIIDPNPAIMLKWKTLLKTKNNRAVRLVYFTELNEFLEKEKLSDSEK